MDKIISIAIGWFRFVFRIESRQAKERMKICMGCDKKKHFIGIGDCCGICGCVLKAKTRVPKERCEIGKW